MNIDPITKPNIEVNSNLPHAGAGEILDGPAKDTEKPLPLHALLTRPVVVSVVNYGMIALLEIAAGSLIPLVWSTSVEFGGLGMSPASIGLCMAAFGFLNGFFQYIAFPRIVGRFGPRRVFITSILCFFPAYILFPFENLAKRHSGRGASVVVGLLIIMQLFVIAFSDMGFSKLPGTSLCVRPLKWCGFPRLGVYVHILRCAEQAVSRRYEWRRADDGLDPAHGRTSCSCVAVCILTAQQHIGGKLCVCRAIRHGVGWAGRRFEASEEYGETWTVDLRKQKKAGRTRYACSLTLYDHKQNKLFIHVRPPSDLRC